MKILKINIITLLLIAISFAIHAQDLCDTLPFINCIENNIIVNDDHYFDSLSEKINSLNTNNQDNVTIVHIGDSHLQAGFLTEKIKQELNTIYLPNDNFAAPGFIFPYTIAETNNPFFFEVSYTGNWSWCKNVDQNTICNLGLSGITLLTKDSTTAISIKMDNKKYNTPKKYLFDKINILHNQDSNISIVSNRKLYNQDKNYSFLQLDQLTDSINITVNLKDTNRSFELYGLILENSKTSINYHTIGVNGATAQSYLKCNYFSDQLSVINPDLIVISLGTNEAYDEGFSGLEHEYILKDLILQIKDASPDANLILITPNDHLKDNISNNNVKRVRNNILKICKEYNLTYWDFYTIMGGEGSIEKWYNKELTGNDKLHFRKKGYEIQGQLFVDALIQLLNQNREK